MGQLIKTFTIYFAYNFSMISQFLNFSFSFIKVLKHIKNY